MKFELLKYIIKGLHYPLTWSNGFCGGRSKRGALVEKGMGPWQKKCCDKTYLMIFIYLFILILIFFFSAEEKMKRKEWSKLGFCQNCPFWTYVQKNQRIHFWVHGHSSWSTFGLYLVMGSKAL